MFTIFICIALGIFTLYFQSRRFIEAKESTKVALEKATYNKTVFGNYILFLYIAMIIFALVSLVYSINIKDDNGISLGIILISLGCGELLNFNNSHTIYHNDNGLIVNGRTIRYRSIKSIKVRGLTKQTLDITTLKGDIESTNIKSYEFIQQHTKIKL